MQSKTLQGAFPTPAERQKARETAKAEEVFKQAEVQSSEEKAQEAQKKPNKQDKQEAKVKPTPKGQEAMSNAYWYYCLKSENLLIFHFLDGSTVKARLIGFDRYNLKLRTEDDKQILVFKHALKWVEGA